MAEIRLELRGAFPHQQDFLDCPKRYAIAASGTKAGKSACGAMYGVRELVNRPGCRGWWVAPSFDVAVSVGLEAVRSLLPRDPDLVQVKTTAPPEIRIVPTGSVLAFKSGDNPDSLYGPGVDFAILDEAGRLAEAAFVAVRSTLTFTGGPMRLLTNPTPRTGWFWRLYTRGLDPGDQDVQSFRWKTADNPLISREEIEDARRNLAESTFRSLYEGEFLDIGGSVFRGVRQAATGALKTWEKGRRYVGGLDLARTVDWTVATVVDVDAGELVAFERWHGAAWEMTVGRVAELAKKYPGTRFNVDSTGLGDPVLEMLERNGVDVEGVKFTATGKSHMVERLAALIEKGRLKYPPLEVLMGELESYEASTGPTGVVRYGAPQGMHDDAVTALMLATKDLDIEPEVDDGVPTLFSLPRMKSTWRKRVC